MTYDSDSPPKKRATKSTIPRALSASEIARNSAHFETWSSYQGCEIAAYSDLPEEVAELAADVFDTSACLPRAWFDPVSRHFYVQCLPPAERKRTDVCASQVHALSVLL